MTFLGVQARADLSALHRLCEQRGTTVPLLAARAALTQLGAATGPVLKRGEGAWSGAGISSSLSLLSLLCKVNTSQGPETEGLRGPPRSAPPRNWTEAYEHLRAAVGAGFGEGSPQARAMDGGTVTAGAFTDLAARFHLNRFSVELPRPLGGAAAAGAGGFGAALEEALAGNVAGGTGGGSSRAGSAVYLVPSLFNHSCEPSVDVAFPGGTAAMELRARRDVAAGEELTISYLDSALPRAQRQEHLLKGYGFECRCPLCEEQRED